MTVQGLPSSRAALLPLAALLHLGGSDAMCIGRCTLSQSVLGWGSDRGLAQAGAAVTCQHALCTPPLALTCHTNVPP